MNVMASPSSLAKRYSEALSDLDTPLVLEAFSHIASSVFIVSTATGGLRHGRTATAVTVVSPRPAQVLVSVAQDGGMIEDIEQAGGFSLDLLAAHQQRTADIFAGRAGLEGDRRFNDRSWRSWPSGNPRLEAAVLNLDCRLVTHLDAGGHRLFLGRVQALNIGGGTPLIYQRRGYQPLALDLPAGDP